MARRAVQLLVSLALSGFFVWLSVRGTDVGAIGHAIAAADLRFVGLALGCLVAVHFVRVYRWGRLLEPVAQTTFAEVNALGAVGFMALMVLPLRLGEFARPMLVADRLKVKRSAAFASVVVERVVDGLFMGFVLVVLLWGLGGRLQGSKLEYVRLGSGLVTIAFGAGLVALVVAVRHRAWADRLTRRLVSPISPKLADKLTGMLAAFTDGLLVVPSLGRLVEFVLLTAIYWGLNAAALCALAPAFGFTLSPLEGLTVLGLQVIGSMIPAGPGMVGTLQAFTKLGLELFLTGPDVATRSAAFAHVGWALSFGQQVLFGLYFLAIGRIRPAALLGTLRPAPASDSALDSAPDQRS